jgi:glycosyltransferase involved in cell wall biosynthesis
VVSDIPVLREVLEDSAYFVDPMNFKIAEGIDKVLTNQEYKVDILTNREELLSKYTWFRCADQIFEVFKEFSFL